LSFRINEYPGGISVIHSKEYDNPPEGLPQSYSQCLNMSKSDLSELIQMLIDYRDTIKQ
jgi:hypothetical protein